MVWMMRQKWAGKKLVQCNGVMQSPVPGKEQLHAPVQAGVCLGGKQLCDDGSFVVDRKLNVSQQCAPAAKKS